METFAAAWNALIREPIALVMAVVALVLAIFAIGVGVRLRERLFALAVAVISGVTSWMIATGWRWPQ